MNNHLIPALVLLAATSLATRAAAAQAAEKPGLQQVLAKMNESSAHFHSVSASFRMETVSPPPVPDVDVQNGSSFVQREGGRIRMGAEIQGPEAKTISYDNGNLRLYQPGLKCYNDYSGKANQGKIESFLTLGFGGSGTELERSWHIQDGGEQTLTSDGRQVKVRKLTLTPLTSNDLVKSITLWIDPERDIALKQVRVTPTDEQQTVTYSNIKLGPVDTARYAIGGKPCSAGGKN